MAVSTHVHALLPTGKRAVLRLELTTQRGGGRGLSLNLDNRLSISPKNSKSPDFQQSLRHISSISYSIHRNVLRKKTLVEKKIKKSVSAFSTFVVHSSPYKLPAAIPSWSLLT